MITYKNELNDDIKNESKINLYESSDNTSIKNENNNINIKNQIKKEKTNSLANLLNSPDKSINDLDHQEFIDISDDNNIIQSTIDHNIVYCNICKQPGTLLCCDGCPLSFHLKCLNIDILPEDNWYCSNCILKKEKMNLQGSKVKNKNKNNSNSKSKSKTKPSTEIKESKETTQNTDIKEIKDKTDNTTGITSEKSRKSAREKKITKKLTQDNSFIRNHTKKKLINKELAKANEKLKKSKEILEKLEKEDIILKKKDLINNNKRRKKYPIEDLELLTTTNMETTSISTNNTITNKNNIVKWSKIDNIPNHLTDLFLSAYDFIVTFQSIFNFSFNIKKKLTLEKFRDLLLYCDYHPIIIEIHLKLIDSLLEERENENYISDDESYIDNTIIDNNNSNNNSNNISRYQQKIKNAALSAGIPTSNMLNELSWPSLLSNYIKAIPRFLNIDFFTNGKPISLNNNDNSKNNNMLLNAVNELEITEYPLLSLNHKLILLHFLISQVYLTNKVKKMLDTNLIERTEIKRKYRLDNINDKKEYSLNDKKKKNDTINNLNHLLVLDNNEIKDTNDTDNDMNTSTNSTNNIKKINNIPLSLNEWFEKKNINLNDDSTDDESYDNNNEDTNYLNTNNLDNEDDNEIIQSDRIYLSRQEAIQKKKLIQEEKKKKLLLYKNNNNIKDIIDAIDNKDVSKLRLAINKTKEFYSNNVDLLQLPYESNSINHSTNNTPTNKTKKNSVLSRKKIINQSNQLLNNKRMINDTEMCILLDYSTNYLSYLEKENNYNNKVIIKTKEYNKNMNKHYIKKKPLGMDRFFNRYYYFPLLDKKKIFLQINYLSYNNIKSYISIYNSNNNNNMNFFNIYDPTNINVAWYYIHTKEDILNLLNNLDKRGIRENLLIEQIELYFNKIIKNINKTNHFNNDNYDDWNNSTLLSKLKGKEINYLINNNDNNNLFNKDLNVIEKPTVIIIKNEIIYTESWLSKILEKKNSNWPNSEKQKLWYNKINNINDIYTKDINIFMVLAFNILELEEEVYYFQKIKFKSNEINKIENENEINKIENENENENENEIHSSSDEDINEKHIIDNGTILWPSRKSRKRWISSLKQSKTISTLALGLATFIQRLEIFDFSPNFLYNHKNNNKIKNTNLNDMTCVSLNIKEATKLINDTEYLSNETKTDEWEEDCCICGSDGDLICCDKCPQVFHPECIGLRRVPRGKIYCPSCNTNTKLYNKTLLNKKRKNPSARRLRSDDIIDYSIEKNKKKQKKFIHLDSINKNDGNGYDSDLNNNDNISDNDTDTDIEMENLKNNKNNQEEYEYRLNNNNNNTKQSKKSKKNRLMIVDDDNDSDNDHLNYTNINYSNIINNNITDDWDITCCVCGKDGNLLCCDGCPRAFHLNCIHLKTLPKSDWFCDDCKTQTCGYCNKSKLKLLSHVICGSEDGTKGCEKVFHLKCAKLKNVPEADWYCKKCMNKI